MADKIVRPPEAYRMLKRTGALTLALVVMTLVAACGGSTSTPPSGAGGFLVLKNVWVRSAASGGMTAAYFDITNGQLVDDELTAATSPVATSAGVHETTTDASGMMGMHEVSGVVIKAGQTQSFAPGGYHVMLIGLNKDLKAGDTVELQLTFKVSGTIKSTATVRDN